MGTKFFVGLIGSKTQIIRIATALITLTALLGCRMEPGGNNTPNTVTWTGAWENDTELYGTFTLTMTLEGENMDKYGGSGTIAGTVVFQDINGSSISDTSISGTWENDRSHPYDYLDFTTESADGRLTINAYIHDETASSISNGTWEMGSFALTLNENEENGAWHTNPASDGITLFGEGALKVESAVTIDINSTAEILDLTYVGTPGAELYATVLEGSTYKIVSINVSDGSVSEVTTSCTEPWAITDDGTYTWVVGNQTSGSTPSLYKYNSGNLSAPESGYPADNAALSAANAISWYGSTLSCHNGSILTSAIGEINTSTGAITAVLYEPFGSPPNLARTTKLERTADGYHTTYFAPGDVWCEYRILDTDGSLQHTYYCPTNATGPIAVSGSHHYLIQGNPNRLYVFNESGG